VCESSPGGQYSTLRAYIQSGSSTHVSWRAWTPPHVRRCGVLPGHRRVGISNSCFIPSAPEGVGLTAALPFSSLATSSASSCPLTRSFANHTAMPSSIVQTKRFSPLHAQADGLVCLHWLSPRCKETEAHMRPKPCQVPCLLRFPHYRFFLQLLK